MSQATQLPCDADGICMLCKTKPSNEEALTCNTCVTPWHASCLLLRPETLASTLQWECPDCTTLVGAPVVSAVGTGGCSDELVNAIRAIESDKSLTDREKAKKRQELLSGQSDVPDLDGDDDSNDGKGKDKAEGGNDVLALLGENFKCSFCMQLPERPVTTPCGHNFCLKCFQKWIREGKSTCVKCRGVIPSKMASQPRINSSLVEAIRMARMSKSIVSGGSQRIYTFIHNQDRPDKAFTSVRAKKAGMANASSGRIFVTVPGDHFGPILAENDPVRKQGVLVGESWELRMECRQWGVHYPPVAGIAGQSDYGAQSVVLSGGYEDDEDHGEWFLYTGSGGRDLSGNKRTNKDQSFDQKFDASNEALRVSCKKGYPVRVVRSYKEKRSSYAPEKGLRYDGIYRIEKCWRKEGKQGFKVCRYLFVRCDNEPAPWTTDEHGDRPRPHPLIPELKKAAEVSDRKDSPSWDYDVEKERWVWKKPPPISRKQVSMGNSAERKQMRIEIRAAQHMTVKQKLLKEFRCSLCKDVMKLPLTTPCAHNFCKACLEAKFSGKTFTRDRTCHGGRTLRAQKNVMECPSCTTDISDFLQNPQVNRELMDVIEKLQSEEEERKEDEGCSEAEVSNGETEENGGCKRKETETDEKPVSTPKRKKTEAEVELPKEEAPDADECSDILSEKEGSQADATTEEAGCKRKPEAVTEKPKKHSKRKKTEAEVESLKTEEAEEKVDEVAAPVVKAKTKRAKKKTETKAEITKVDEEKITEEKVDENGEIDEEKVDDGDKVEATAAVAVVKRRGKKASIVKEINESGLRRGRSASKGGV